MGHNHACCVLPAAVALTAGAGVILAWQAACPGNNARRFPCACKAQGLIVRLVQHTWRLQHAGINMLDLYVGLSWHQPCPESVLTVTLVTDYDTAAPTVSCKQAPATCMLPCRLMVGASASPTPGQSAGGRRESGQVSWCRPSARQGSVAAAAVPAQQPMQCRL